MRLGEDDAIPTSPPDPRYDDPRYDDPRFRLGFARTVTHFFSQDHFLADGQLLADAHRLAGTPGALVQGALDLANLLGTPWRLAGAWPDADLVLVDHVGHDGGAPPILTAIRAATDRLASSVR